RRDLLRPPAPLHLGADGVADPARPAAAAPTAADRRLAALVAGPAGGLPVPAPLPARVLEMLAGPGPRGAAAGCPRPSRSLLADARAEAREAPGGRTDRAGGATGGAAGMSDGAANTGAPLLEVTNLVKHFPIKRGVLIDREGDQVGAVDGVSFKVEKGETLGLVGESGSGKSTACRAVLQLLEPTSGSVKFEGREIAGLGRRQMRPLRREMQMIFQDPYASLNPRKRIGQIVGDPLRRQGVARGGGLRQQVQELLERVGLAGEHYNRFPHEFSGGQRQRIGIARALALKPKLV